MHLVILNVISPKKYIFKTLDNTLPAVGPNSYSFSVHRPAQQKRQENFGASRTYLWYKQWFAYIDLECYFLKMTCFNTFSRWYYSYAFIISSPELKKHQETFEAC